MPQRSSRAVHHFKHVYLHARTALDAGDKTTVVRQVTYAPDVPRLFWLRKMPEDPQFEPHAGIKMAQVLGSLVYIYDVNLKSCRV